MARMFGLLLALTAAVSAQVHSSTTSWVFTGTGNTVPTGLAIQQYSLPATPASSQAAQTRIPSNVYQSGGYLNLRVPANQNRNGVISGGEIATTFNVSSARVDTYGILSNVAGVVDGAFMYYNAKAFQEIDIEWLSDPNSKSLNNGVRQLLYTSYGPSGKSTARSPAPNDTFAVHNFRMDWFTGKSEEFFLDGQSVAKITTNVPDTRSTKWVWNCWSNGDPGYSVGPPVTNDAIFRIQKIVMYYNPPGSA